MYSGIWEIQGVGVVDMTERQVSNWCKGCKERQDEIDLFRKALEDIKQRSKENHNDLKLIIIHRIAEQALKKNNPKIP